MKDEERKLSEVLSKLEDLEKLEKENNKKAEDILEDAINDKDYANLFDQLDSGKESVKDRIGNELSRSERRYDVSESVESLRSFEDTETKTYMTYDGKKMNSMDNAKAYNELLEQLEKARRKHL